MNRRKAIQRTVQVMGGAISSSALSGMMSGCTPSREIEWTPRLLTKDQSLVAGEVAEQIIPRTETVGALDVGVDQFIDLMLADNYKLDEQKIFLAGLDELQSNAQATFGESFVDCTQEEKVQLLAELESNIGQPIAPRNRPFWLTIKELTLLGYFTSEEGLKQNLIHIPVPGSLEGCIPAEPEQKLKVGNNV